MTNNSTNLFDEKLIQRISNRLVEAKMRILYKFPFYGNLIMRLRFSIAKCGTAGTDMRKIVFDPEFVDDLSDAELDFVLMHEVMHCVLQHCLRGKNYNQHFFNIACDIVVNSNIMHSMGTNHFTIAGEEVMHLTPGNEEGYKYTAEDVYEMLKNKYGLLINDVTKVLNKIENDYGVIFDRHDIWKTIPLEESLSDEWKQHIIDAAKGCSENEIPPSTRDYIEYLNKESSLNWKEILHDFIKIINDKYDYSFVPPDRRFSTGDFILPAYVEEHGDQVNNLWFVIDTSGSISIKMLSTAFYEVKAAMSQFEYLSGKLSFFDTRVTDPIEFDNIDDLKDVKPSGGGGTSFHCIFEYMKTKMLDDLPTAIIILTDGGATYPAESAALGVPVLWIIAENDTLAPWGTTVLVKN